MISASVVVNTNKCNKRAARDSGRVVVACSYYLPRIHVVGFPRCGRRRRPRSTASVSSIGARTKLPNLSLSLLFAAASESTCQTRAPKSARARARDFTSLADDSSRDFASGGRFRSSRIVSRARERSHREISPATCVRALAACACVCALLRACVSIHALIVRASSKVRA